MTPAQQRFEARDLVGGDVNKRLVVEFELAVGKGATQVDFHLAALLRQAVHFPFEEAVSTSAVGLGAVKRHVSVAS
jgi:hypothetical protein